VITVKISLLDQLTFELSAARLNCGYHLMQVTVHLYTVHWNLEDCSLTEQVNLWHFITTDIGSKAETCVLLEQKFARQLVALACSRHIHELIASPAFQTLFD